jgi:hypothetical protein
MSDVYHMVVPLGENTPDVDIWVEAIDATYKGVGKPFGEEEWDSLLGDFMVCCKLLLLQYIQAYSKAVTDYHCALFIDELIAAYPDAKIIFTVRNSREA